MVQCSYFFVFKTFRFKNIRKNACGSLSKSDELLQKIGYCSMTTFLEPLKMRT